MATATIKNSARPSGSSKKRPVASELREIPLSLVDLHPDDVRDEMSVEEIKQLAESIEEYGVVQTITVRPIDRGRYQCIAGGRRVRAARKAGLNLIPAIVRSLSDAESLLFLIVENEMRRNLNPLELARGLKRLHEPKEQGGAGLTELQIAEKFGHVQGWTSLHLRLLEMPEFWKSKVVSGELSLSSVRELMRFRTSEAIMAAAERDYKENPDLYLGWRATKRQMELIVAQHPVVKPGRWDKPREERAIAAAGCGREDHASVRTHNRLPAAKSDGKISDAAVEIICQVRSVTSRQDLYAIQAAIGKRLEQLTAGGRS